MGKNKFMKTRMTIWNPIATSGMYYKTTYIRQTTKGLVKFLRILAVKIITSCSLPNFKLGLKLNNNGITNHKSDIFPNGTQR